MSARTASVAAVLCNARLAAARRAPLAALRTVSNAAAAARSAAAALHTRAVVPRVARSASTAVARAMAATSTRHVAGASTHMAAASAVRQHMSVRNFASGSYPAHVKLLMPALSPTMASGNIAKWQKKEGEKVSEGDVLCDVETDKATVAFESTEAGYMAKILVPDGTPDVPVGKLVAILVENESDVAAFKDFSADGAAAPASKPAEAPKKAEAAPQAQQQQAAPSPPPQQQQQQQQPQQQAQQQQASSSGDRQAASPLAKKLAAEKGVDLKEVSPTGPNNRIIAADVREFQPRSQAATAAAAPSAGAGAGAEWYTDIPLSNMRKVIAKRLLESKQTIPHYYLSVDCNVDELLKLRTKLNAELEAKLSVNDFIIKASALALRKVPQVNASWMEKSIRQYKYVDISVAVSTDAGLITPVIKDADLKGLSRLSSDMKSLATKARENKLQPEEYQGGTFTISNLGMFGVKNFSAIINPPQSVILAVGGAESRVIPNEGADAATNPYKTAKFMSVTVSCDHRVVDGALGAQWLQAFKNYIEKPHTMLL